MMLGLKFCFFLYSYPSPHFVARGCCLQALRITVTRPTPFLGVFISMLSSAANLRRWCSDTPILNVTWVFDVFAISFFQLLGSLTLPTSLHQRVLYIAFYIPASEPVWTAGGFFLHLLLHSLHGVFDCTQILLPCIFLDMPTGSVQPIPSWWGCLWLWHFCAFCSGIGQNLWHDSAKHCRPGGPTQVNPKWLTPKLRCCEIKVANHVWVAKAHCSPLGP